MNTLISEAIFGLLGIVAIAMMIELIARANQDTLNVDGTIESNQFSIPFLNSKWLNDLANHMKEVSTSTAKFLTQVDTNWHRANVLECKIEELRTQRDQLAQILQELKINESVLLESRKKAELHKLKAGVAHELNNALNVLGGVIKPLQKDFSEIRELVKGESANLLMDEVDILLAELNNSTSRVHDSANNFIDLIPDNRNKGRDEETLYESLQSKLYWLRLSYPEIEFNFHIERPLRFYRNDHELLLIVNNLLINSIEAVSLTMEPNIELMVVLKNGKILVSISDNGVGISEEHQIHVFEPFYTCSKSDSAAGLGLFVVAGLVEKKNGTVNFESNAIEKGGVTFQVMLPIEAA